MSKTATRDYRDMIDGPPGSPQWRAKRRAYMEGSAFQPLREAVERRSDGICERVDDSGQIRCENPAEVVHHLTYIREFHEHLRDLQHICKGCHAFVHEYSPDDPLLAYRPKDLSLEVSDALFVNAREVEEIGTALRNWKGPECIGNHGHVYVQDGSRLHAGGDYWLPKVDMFHDCPIGTIGKHRYKLAIQNECGEQLFTLEWANDAAFACKAAIECSEALYMFLLFGDMPELPELFLGFGSLNDAEDWLHNFQVNQRPGYHNLRAKPARHPRLQCKGKTCDIDAQWVSRCFGGDFWWHCHGYAGTYARIWQRLWEPGSQEVGIPAEMGSEHAQ